MAEIKLPLRIKIISMGDAGVGKSCIIKRYCEKRFVTKYLATIGIDYGVTRVRVGTRDVKINFFDMSGHKFFYEVRNEFYRDTQGAILVFDVGNKASFDALPGWMEELKNNIGNPKDSENVVFVVCANKSDARRVVDDVEARLWADSQGMQYFETSASSGNGVNEMFQALFDGVVCAFENGGKPAAIQTSIGYTKEQIQAIQRLRSSKDNYERLGLKPGATKDEINNAYRKLAKILHPDKNVAPGSEEAFKILLNARTALLKNS